MEVSLELLIVSYLTVAGFSVAATVAVQSLIRAAKKCCKGKTREASVARNRASATFSPAKRMDRSFEERIANDDGGHYSSSAAFRQSNTNKYGTLILVLPICFHMSKEAFLLSQCVARSRAPSCPCRTDGFMKTPGLLQTPDTTASLNRRRICLLGLFPCRGTTAGKGLQPLLLFRPLIFYNIMKESAGPPPPSATAAARFHLLPHRFCEPRGEADLRQRHPEGRIHDGHPLALRAACCHSAAETARRHSYFNDGRRILGHGLLAEVINRMSII